MAAVRVEKRTSGVFLLLFLIANSSAVQPPWILSARVADVACDAEGGRCAYSLDVDGEFAEWALTYSRSGCETVFAARGGRVEAPPPPTGEGALFFCARGAGGGWRHQGGRLYLDAGDVTL